MEKRVFMKSALVAGVIMMALMLSGCNYLGYFLADTPDAVSAEPAESSEQTEQTGQLQQKIAELEGMQGSTNATAEDATGGAGTAGGTGISFPYEFSATDLYGNAVTAASLGEKEVYFVHLWATWCGPCISEMPDFPEIMEAYGDRVGFLALLTDYSDNLDGAVNIVERAGIPDSFIMIDAFEPSVLPLMEMLDSGYVPTTVLISASGVSDQIVGAEGPAYADYLDEILT